MAIRREIVFVASGLALAGITCSPLNPTLPTSASRTPQLLPSASTPLPPSSAALLLTATPSVPSVVAARELSSVGPWIVFPDYGGIWGLNEDGTGLSLLSSDQPRQIAPAPAGGLVAYLTEGQSLSVDDSTLHIYSMPLRMEIASIPVTPAGTEIDPEDPEWYRAAGATEAASGYYGSPLAWSPDGTRLAFAGVIEGDSADLYTYSIETGEVMRLSFEPGQVYNPAWSPDGKYIAYFEVESFCCGAGYNIDDGWVALADGSKTAALEMGFGSDVHILGWHGSEPRFYSLGSLVACGSFGLDEVNAATGEVIDLRVFASDVSLDRRGAGIILIGTQECEGEPSLMAISPSNEVRPISLAGATAVDWLRETRPGHPSYAVASTERGQYLITAQGEVLPMNAPPGTESFPSQVPGTDILLWAGDGLWMGSLTDLTAAPVQIFDGQVDKVFASSDADELVFFSSDGLWVASASDAFLPVHVSEGTGWYAVRVEQ